MNIVPNLNGEPEGIFLGKPSKEDLINYFMKEQRLATIKKMEEIDRDKSPDLSESFEIYLQQRKNKIEMERKKLNDKYSTEENTKIETFKMNEEARGSIHSFSDISYNIESFIELEKMCENTLNLNNVSEVFADLTTLELKSDPETHDLDGRHTIEDIQLQEVDQPSFFFKTLSLVDNDECLLLKDNREVPASITMESAEMSLSYQTTQSQCTSLHSILSTDKSEYYRTANDKSFESVQNSSSISKLKLNEGEDKLLDNRRRDSSINPTFSKSIHQKLDKDINEPDEHSINDTLDEIDFLLSQAQKLNNSKDLNLETKMKSKTSVVKHMPSPKSENKKIYMNTSKNSPLISFSPLTKTGINSPTTNFKIPKPASSTKIQQLTKVNNRKYQHIVSPVSRYIQTSEPVLNANVHVQYKGVTARRQFNFRDSENFDRSHDSSVKISSLPLRAKTNILKGQAKDQHINKTSEKENKVNPMIAAHNNRKFSETNMKTFVDNTLNDTEAFEENFWGSPKKN